jgi:putative flippase GtrA
VTGLLSNQFVRFLFAGGSAAAVNFLSRILYSEFFTFSVAIVLAYLTGMVTAYLLNRVFVFDRGDHSTGREIVYFCLVNVVAVLQTWLISMGLYFYFLSDKLPQYAEELSHFIGVIIPVFTSFMGHKYLTFKITKADKL